MWFFSRLANWTLMFFKSTSLRVLSLEKLVWQPDPFQSPLMGLGR
jgi:hypothetical protein